MYLVALVSHPRVVLLRAVLLLLLLVVLLPLVQVVAGHLLQNISHLLLGLLL